MDKKLDHLCRVCGTSLEGTLGFLFYLFGIKRSQNNPNVCNRCDAHIQEGHVIELTVLFADLTGFTSLTNRLGPERSYEVINEFFKMANQVLIQNDAFIDKYIGDAVMAIFNAPIQNARHARKAADSALGILEGLKAVSEATGLELKARVGIATGYARVGRLGSAERKEYTAIGDVVNLASRLEAQANPGEIVVDGRAFAQMVEDYPGLAPETLSIRGFAEPIEAYRICKADRELAAAAIQPPLELAARRKMSLGAILFSILGAPCAVATSLSPIAIALGLGSFMGALGPVFSTLDAAQIRIPMQMFAILGAIVNLYAIHHGSSRRKNAGEMDSHTAFENRKINMVTGLSIFSLLAVVFENYVHIFVLKMSYFTPVL